MLTLLDTTLSNVVTQALTIGGLIIALYVVLVSLNHVIALVNKLHPRKERP